MRRFRILGAALLIQGAILLVARHAVARTTSGSGREPPAPVVRLCGAQLFLQGAVMARYPTSAVLSIGIKANAIHAGSMLLPAQYRRSALWCAVAAAGSVVAAVAAQG